MNFKLFNRTCITFIAACTTILFSNLPSYAKRTSFICDVSNHPPATIAKTPRGDIKVIVWVSSDNEGNPQERCQKVSSRFQTYYNNGLLSYLTVGFIDNRFVVCVAREKDGPCIKTLFNLKSGSDPNKTLQDLLRVRAYKGGPIYEGAEGRIYINMDEYLKIVPVDNNSSPSN